MCNISPGQDFCASYLLPQSNSSYFFYQFALVGAKEAEKVKFSSEFVYAEFLFAFDFPFSDGSAQMASAFIAVERETAFEEIERRFFFNVLPRFESNRVKTAFGKGMRPGSGPILFRMQQRTPSSVEKFVAFAEANGLQTLVQATRDGAWGTVYNGFSVGAFDLRLTSTMLN